MQLYTSELSLTLRMEGGGEGMRRMIFVQACSIREDYNVVDLSPGRVSSEMEDS